MFQQEIMIKSFCVFEFIIIMLFESLQIMYILFAFLPSIGTDFQTYFKSFQYLSFGGRDIFLCIKRLLIGEQTEISKENYNELVFSFPDITIILLASLTIMIIQFKWRRCAINNIRISSFIKTWIFLCLQFLSLSIFNNILLFHKIHDMLGAISILSSIIIGILIAMYIYCCIINRQSNCYICSKLEFFEWLKNIPIFEEIKSENFRIFLISNQIRRLVILVFIQIGIEGYLLFVYIACILIIQVYYQVIIFSKEIFKNMKDRIFINISEMLLFLIILICCSMFNLSELEGINLSFNSSCTNDGLTKILKTMIKIYIFCFIFFELISLCCYFLPIIKAKCSRKNQIPAQSIHSNLRIEHNLNPPQLNLNPPQINLNDFTNIGIPEESKIWNVKSKKHNPYFIKKIDNKFQPS